MSDEKSTNNEKHQPFATDKLIEAYDRMMERTKELVETTVQQPIEKAMETAIELGELTREEAEKVAAYIRRDLEETARHLSESGKELRDWFRFDVQQIEARMWETFSKLVDYSRIELGRLTGTLQTEETWHTGEITGIGTLVCTQCGKEIHFHETGRIPPCPKCHGTVYKRGKE
ncbi:MAG: zinc ribbon-containing protein [Gammaproteobacteria bacterium]